MSLAQPVAKKKGASRRPDIPSMQPLSSAAVWRRPPSGYSRGRSPAASGFGADSGPVATTVSIGVAGGPAGTELEVLLAAADTALYQAKRAGRNRVEAAEELPLSLENWRRKTAGTARQPTVQPALRGLPSA